MSPTTVVLVELDDEVFAIACRICKRPGYLVAQAGDPEAGMRYIERQLPAAVITAHHAEGDTLLWLAQVRHVVPDALIIVVGDEADLTVLDAGADIVLPAPLGERALEAALNGICGDDGAPRLTLLVVEPDPHLASVMLRWLGRTFDASLVATGWRAVEVIRERRPDAVLAELRLPDMDAAELHAAIDRVVPGLGERVLFMTAGFIPDKAQQFLARIPGQSIYKPFDLTRLRVALAALFD